MTIFYTRRRFMEKNVELFKLACEEYLVTEGVSALRAYGRAIELKEPTKMKKQELVKEIVGVLCGEIVTTQRTNRGAPVKNDYIEPRMAKEIARLKQLYLGEEAEEEEISVLSTAIESEKEENCPSVVLKFEVRVSSLTERQKQLMNDFLSSL